MLRNLLDRYQPAPPAGDIQRYDLPDERFRITLANLPETEAPPAVSAYHPLRATDTPARLVSSSGATATFAIAATDYPRVLGLEYPAH